ncbi:MAG: hypothetical protein Q4C51_05830 [Clostridia bacterium]|nr:hypothetical protein [Clostridia bacterium]
MKWKMLILFTVLLTLCMMTSCSNIKNTEENKEASKSQGGISLPCEDELIVDVKADKGKIMLSTMSVAEDFSTSTATIWESADEGEHWGKVYEKQFVSDKTGEIYINAEIHFVEQGGILQVYQWPKDNAKAEYSKIYYLNDLENGLMEEVKSDCDMKNLGSTYFLSNDNLYGWDFMSGELLCLNLKNGNVQKTKFDDVDMLLNVVFDGSSAYIGYLSKKYVYTGMKYDVLKQNVEDSPVFEAMIKEFGKSGYNMITGVRYYPCIKDNKEIYRYVCSDGVFEFDDSGSKQINTSVSWGKSEDVNFEKVEVFSNEQLLVYYTGLNENNSYMSIDKIDLRNEC